MRGSVFRVNEFKSGENPVQKKFL